MSTQFASWLTNLIIRMFAVNKREGGSIAISNKPYLYIGTDLVNQVLTSSLQYGGREQDNELNDDI